MSESRRADRGEIGVVAVLVGAVYVAIGVARGRVDEGISGGVIIVLGVALALGLRRRSETAQLLSGTPADERQAAIVTRASALTGQVLLGVLVVSWLVALASGSGSAATLGWLCTVGGATSVLATAWYARRG